MRWTLKVDVVELVLIGAVLGLATLFVGKTCLQNRHSAPLEEGQVIPDPPNSEEE